MNLEEIIKDRLEADRKAILLQKAELGLSGEEDFLAKKQLAKEMQIEHVYGEILEEQKRENG